MGNCKNCKWWNPESYEEIIYEWGVCELTRLAQDSYEHPDSKALAMGDYNAYLHTNPDFGCVQFEEKSVTH